MDEDAGHGFIRDGDGRGHAVRDGEVGRRRVQLVALCRLDLHGVVVARAQIDVDTPHFVGGDGIDQTAVHAPDFKRSVGNTLALVCGVYLDKLQTALGGIEKGERLRRSALDEDALRGGVENVAAGSLDLFRRDGHTRRKAAQNNAPVAISGVFAVVRPDHRAGAVRDEERNTRNRRSCAGDVLLQGKRLRGAVIKCEHLFVAAFERDGLRLTVQQIPVRSPDFLCCDGRTRLQIAQNDLTVFVRDVLSVRRADRRAATVGDKETDAFDRCGGALDELLNDKDAKRLVIEGHGIAVCRRAAGGGESRRYGLARRAAADHDGLRRTVERVALGGLDFAGDQRHSRREAGQHDAARFVGDVFAVGTADRSAGGVGHKEGHAGNRGGRAIRVLLNDGALLRRIRKHDSLRVVRVDLDCL